MSNIPFKEFLIRSKFNIKKAKEYEKSYDIIMESGLFDKNYYLKAYPHVADSNMDPLIHYLFYGYSEHKFPSASFHLGGYLKEHPDLIDNGINPLIHYINNNHEGFIYDELPSVVKKNKIEDTNRLFLHNYEFENEPLVSIIILTRDGLNHLKCLFKDFSKKTNYSNYEIIVVDNASKDGSVEYLKSLDLPITIIENKENVSFSKGNNDAAQIANGEYLLLLNNDIEPTYGWLNEMVGVMLNNDDVGSVGAKLLFPYYDDIAVNGKSYSIQHGGVKFREERTPYIYGPYHDHMFSTLIFSGDVNHQKEVIACTAACLLIPKEIYFKLGMLDEEYFYGYEDIDFAFKLYSEGYKTIYTPSALLFHHESASRKDDAEEIKDQLNYQNIMHFLDKWGDFMFREILNDKISKNHFITDKKLKFTIVGRYNPFLAGLVKSLNSKGYDVNVIPDENNLVAGSECDVLISTNPDYDIEHVISRLNLIKILIGEEESKLYDMVISKNIFKDDYADELLTLIEEKYL